MQQRDNSKNQSMTVASIDIGTCKITGLAGFKDEYGKVKILAESSVKSNGVLRGIISNTDKVSRSIKEVVKNLENRIGQSIDAVYVGISNKYISNMTKRGILTRDDLDIEVSVEDIEKLITDMHKVVLKPGLKILDIVPQEFMVDSEQGITDPIGMAGRRIEANFDIITTKVTAMHSIERSIEKSGLKMRNMRLNSLASADAVLSEEEKEAGVALIDMGGATTDIAIFKDGILRYSAVVAFGGNAITDDIKSGCCVMPDSAEKLKLKHGTSMPSLLENNTVIAIPGINGRDSKRISQTTLAMIIQARVEEVFDFIMLKLQESGYERQLIAGIVLTGGSSMLSDIKKTVELCTGMSTRLGYPIDKLASGYKEDLYHPAYATAIGLLINGIEMEAEREANAEIKKQEEVIVEEEAVVPVQEVAAEAEEKKEPVLVEEEQEGWFKRNIIKPTIDFFEEKNDSDL